MNVPVPITIERDGASPALAAFLDRVDPHRLATRIAVPLARHWRDHLKGLPRNRQGYPSTGFWEDASRRVVGLAQGGDVLLYCDKVGIKQRLYGGPIEAVNVKNLSIPICAESYGTSPKDWGESLTLVVFLDTKKAFLALVLNAGNRVAYGQTVDAAINRFNKGKAAGKIQAHAAERSARAANKYGSRAGDVPKVIFFRSSKGGVPKVERNMDLKFLFVLVPKTNPQAANANVIPPDLADKAREAVEEDFERYLHE